MERLNQIKILIKTFLFGGNGELNSKIQFKLANTDNGDGHGNIGGSESRPLHSAIIVPIPSKMIVCVVDSIIQTILY